jgi:3-methyladenine DNA glycosylase AlkD
MNYFLLNPEQKRQIKELLKKIRLSQNGVVAELMTNKGVVYKQNYGVSIPGIRAICSHYPKNGDLAQRLWVMGIRETMIAATLLAPPETFKKETAEKWIAECRQIELIEQLCMNLLSKLKYAEMLSVSCINSADRWEMLAGFTLAVRIYGSYSGEQVRQIVEKAVPLAEIEDFLLQKSIAAALGRLSRTNKNVAGYILQSINGFKDSASAGKQYIYQEVEQEILFYK